MQSCPDPSIIQSQSKGDSGWYLYCTAEQFSDGGPLHLISISRSDDLVNWTYVGDVFNTLPAGAATNSGLWAPDIHYFDGKYYLYYAVSETRTTSGGSAIFAATSSTPTGPWTQVLGPVVEPQAGRSGKPRSTIDPAIVDEDGHRYIIFGSYNGGILARELSADNLTTRRDTEVRIALEDRYEAAYVIRHEGYYYLFVSASNCCLGDLTGYGVFAARSMHALGPYVDQTGHSLTEARIGGTPVLSMNGNRWVGPGHNATFADAKGQDWMVYHAIDRNRPYFADGGSRRPAMMDPIHWIDGWPRVRGNDGPSDSAQPAPALSVSGSHADAATALMVEQPSALIAGVSDEFDGTALGPQWRWIRTPQPNSWAVRGGKLELNSQAGDIFKGTNTAFLLTEPAPPGDYMVEVKMAMNVPLTGVHDYVQGGLMIYKDDGDYVKLVENSMGQTRQIEFAKQITSTPGSVPRYGNTFLSSPGDNTWLRLVKHRTTEEDTYTAYSSQDGVNWERGGTWTHSLGSQTRIALVSMSGAGYIASFDYVRVYSVAKM